MVTLLLDSTRLEVALSAAERALSFRRQSVFIDRATITKVQLTDDAWTWLRGVAHRGSYVPGVLAIGTWKSAGGLDFAVIRRRRAAVVIDLDGHGEFGRVVLTTRHGVALVKALQLEADGAATEVTDLADDLPTAPVVVVPVRRPRRRAPKPAPAT